MTPGDIFKCMEQVVAHLCFVWHKIMRAALCTGELRGEGGMLVIQVTGEVTQTR